MKSGLVTIFWVFSLFVLSGCGGSDSSSQAESGPGGGDDDVYSLVNAKSETDCTQVEKNLLDWGAWQSADPSRLGNDPAGAGTSCLQINIDETDQDALAALNEKIGELDETKAESETLCKWEIPSGNTYLCKPPSDLTQIKSSFASYYSTRSNNRGCTNQQITAVGGMTARNTGLCIAMTEEPVGTGNVRVTITDEKFNEHINAARSASESLCFWYVGISNVMTQLFCRAQ